MNDINAIIDKLGPLIAALSVLLTALAAYWRSKAKANEAGLERCVHAIDDCPECKTRIKLQGKTNQDKAEAAINAAVQRVTKCLIFAALLALAGCEICGTYKTKIAGSEIEFGSPDGCYELIVDTEITKALADRIRGKSKEEKAKAEPSPLQPRASDGPPALDSNRASSD